MRFLVGIILFFPQLLSAADYINAHMLDIMQYERGAQIPDRKNKILNAFSTCDNVEIKNLFFNLEHCSGFDAKGTPITLKADSAILERRLSNCCLLDLDGDEEREIMFHEKNLPGRIQVSVILKKVGNNFKVVYKAFGVFSSVIFENHVLKLITSCEFHAYDSPFDVFQINQVSASKGDLKIFVNYRLFVPVNYHYPLRAGLSDKYVELKTDSVYFYYKSLFNELNYPYKVEMRSEFGSDTQFMFRQYDWPVITRSSIKWIGYVENRGDFSSVYIAVNNSYADVIPEYIYVYIPNKFLQVSDPRE